MIPILKTIETADLVPHPCNRDIGNVTDDEWGSFLQSIRANGILTPLHVRPLGDGYQILAGHRRERAAQLVGLSIVPCIVEEMDDADAMAFLVNENLQRSDLTPVDEAMFCRHMHEDLELSESQIAERISRSIHWVRTRQQMLDLGPDVLAAVSTRDSNARLSMDAVEEILLTPADMRDQAVQLVLHPAFDIRPLSAAAAGEAIQLCLIGPRKQSAAWEASRDKLAKEWSKRLKAAVGKQHAASIAIVFCEWANRENDLRGTQNAEAAIPAELLTETAPPAITWAMLAARHGLAIRIIPGADGDESWARVPTQILRDAESALEDSKGDAWLLSKAKKKQEPASNLEAEKEMVQYLQNLSPDDAAALLSWLAKDIAESPAFSGYVTDYRAKNQSPTN